MPTFDPYRKWLGIAPADQPPNHYRLLGLDLFESDPDVIDAATEQRVTYLRQCATGEHVAESQKLLNEVAAARLCLVNADKKREYDAQLRSAHESAQENSPRQGHESFTRIVTDLATILRALLERHPRAIAVTGVVLLLFAGIFLSPQSERAPDVETNQTKSTTSLIGQSAGAEWQANGPKMPFRWCPGWTFNMGSPQTSTVFYHDETPVTVTFSRGFWIGRHEVTQAEWRQVMGTSPWEGIITVSEGDRYPAVYISWNEATLFCRTLTEQERRAGRLPKDWEYRLPTEAQWEFACRASSNTSFSFGDDDRQLVEHAWFITNSPTLKPIHEVGTKRPNAWGLYDMHGNVTEWCRDRYSQTLIGGLDPEAPEGVLPALDRVRRGGSVLSQSTACRSAFRGRDVPARRWYDLGFRVTIVQPKPNGSGEFFEDIR